MPLLVTDPVDWALDPVTGDLVFPIRYTRGLEAVAQGIKFRLRLVQGEQFLDLKAGVPYLEGNGVDPTLVILGKRFDRARADAAFRKAILGDGPDATGVERIVSLGISFESKTRELGAAAVVKTVFGDTPLDVLASVPLGALS